MATYNNKDKERLSLLEQTAQQNNSSNLLVKEPLDRNVAGLHSTGATPTSTAPEGFEGSSKAVYTHNDSQKSVKDQMNENSKLWWDAKAAGDNDWMKSLEAANQQLASLLGDGVTYNPSSGTWSGTADMPATQQAAITTGVTPVLPTYESAYNAKIDELMNAMLTRQKFSYDAESDPLFQQYKNIYTREGNRSMNDTLAAVASGAGGMSSYAMTAAQQANNYYMAQLGDKIPELQQLAYEMYMNDLGQQRQDINMLMDKDSMDYSRYRDQMGDYQWGTELNYGASRDAIADQRYDTEWQHMLDREGIEDQRYNTEWEYGVGRDQIADKRYDQEWNYGVSRDQIADQRYDQEWQYGLTRDQIEDAWREKQFNYGVSRDQIADQRYQQEWDYETSLDEGWGDNPDDNEPLSNPETEAEKEKRYDASKMAIGLGMFNDEVVLNLSDYGGIVFNDDGSISWGPGWNKDNWRKKLDEYQNGLFTFGKIGG